MKTRKKKLDFIVAAIANEKTDGKHFIIYPDGEYNSEWLDLDLKNSSYKAYYVYYDDKEKWYEGKIWNLKFPEIDYQPQKHKHFHIYNEISYNPTLDLYFPLKYKNQEFIKENKFPSKNFAYMDLEKNCIELKNINTLMGQRLIRQAVRKNYLNLVQLLCTKDADYENQSTELTDLEMMTFCLGDTPFEDKPLDIALKNNFKNMANYLKTNNYCQKYDFKKKLNF